ncbi:SirB2 family protein [Brevundimonas sp. 2R-24]|uniref:SirB2 family protein n=1 Tax=Peiella sedimenti TaxID=3061083 RepID=A0ABT8SM13_9CAUL|nr:SirB2 family protein [Caulobacteraceae bacterium XZ-24]
MEEFYIQIRHVHIGAVIASGSLFFLRGAALNLFRQGWAMARPLRWLSYAIDTVLLTAALMLMTIIQQYPFADVWLTTKVMLLVGYVVLGSFALKRGRTPRQRTVAWAAALVVFLFIITVARAHDPLGVFAAL